MDRIIPPLTVSQKIVMDEAMRGLLNYRGNGPVPFRHQGRNLDRGIDCIGYVKHGILALGYAIQDRIDYGRKPAHRKLDETLQMHFGDPLWRKPIRRMEQLMFGDVIPMTWGSESAHLAKVTWHPEGVGILHCYATGPRCVLWTRLDSNFLSLINAVYRP